MFQVDIVVAQAVAYAATVILWVAAVAVRAVEWRVVVRGLRNGLLAALALFALTTAIVALGYADLSIGVTVGAVLGIGFFWLGATLMPLGLLFRATAAWVLYGSWVAVPVIVAAIGFGLAAYRAAQPPS